MAHKITLSKRFVKFSALAAIVLHLMLIASTFLAINFEWLEFFRKLHGG